MSLAILLPEIRNLILGHLSLHPAEAANPVEATQQEINRSALCAYAGASRSFRIEAHRYLFSSLVLEATIYCPKQLALARERISQLAAVITRFGERNMHDTIAQHAKSFGLFVTIPTRPRQRAFVKTFLDSIVVILDALHGATHGINSLSFGATGPTNALWAYDVDTNMEFRRAFEDLLRSANMRHVQLDGISMIPRTLFCGTLIKNVEFYSTDLDPHHPTDMVQSDRHVQPIVLESLGLDETFPFVDILQHGNNTGDAREKYMLIRNSLTRLHYRLTTLNSMYGMIETASHAAKSLRNFHIHFSGPTPNSITLSNPSTSKYKFDLLHKLSSLQISIRTGTSIDWQPIVVHAFRHIFELSILPRELRNLTLEVIAPFFYHSSNTSVSESPFHCEEWTHIATLLGQSSFNCIATINIVFRYCVTVEPNAIVPFSSQVFRDEAKKELEKVLPDFGPPYLRKRNLHVFITVHDLEQDAIADKESDHKSGLTLRCGGKKTWDVSLGGDV